MDAEVHRLGPKDWDPHTDRCLCPKNDLSLLTPEEKADLRALEKAADADSQVQSPALLGRICATVRRLARLTPLDFEFPRYAGFVNPIAGNVIPMRLAGRLLIEKTVTLPSEGAEVMSCRVFEHDTYSRPDELIAFIRPYVRICGTPTEKAIGALRSARIDVDLEGDRIVRQGPLEPHLVGQSFMRLPFGFTVAGSCCHFRAAYLLEKPVQINGFLQGAPGETFGLFLQNGTKVVMEITADAPIPAVELKTGLVAALYTTKP